MSTQRVVVTHRRAHPVWALFGVLVVLGALVHYWYVALGVVAIVVATRAEKRRHALLTAQDREWLGSHGWTG